MNAELNSVNNELKVEQEESNQIKAELIKLRYDALKKDKKMSYDIKNTKKSKLDVNVIKIFGY